MKRSLAVMLCFISFSAMPQKVERDWLADFTSGDYAYAATTNDSGNVLGQWCYYESGNCMYLIASATGCEGDSVYPVLANADTGATVLNIQCRGVFDAGGVKKYRYVFTDFDAIDKLVRAANRVGFAMPLKDGYFNVVRFTLAASNGELDRMRTAVAAKLRSTPKEKPQGTKDMKL